MKGLSLIGDVLTTNKLSVAIMLVCLTASFSVTAELCKNQLCSIVGTNKADVIYGTEADDVICGGNGNDTIFGLQGNDLICGGNGSDFLSGDEGNDVLVGGNGKDELDGGAGQDKLYEASGNDKMYGNPGKDKQKNPKKNNAGFSIAGNKIVDPDGKTFIPKGINIFPLNGDANTIAKITDGCWGFNMVRLHAWILPRQTSPWKDHVVYVDEQVIVDSNAEPYDAYNVGPLIESYTSQGIVVLFDIHDHIGNYFEGQDLADYLTFIKHFANKYKDNPYVWLDIHNEPGTYDGINKDFSKWRAEIPAIMDAVREIAPNMIALIPGAAWGQDTGPRWDDNNILPSESALLANADIIGKYKNVMATIHIYDQWQYGGVPRLKNFIDQLDETLGIPVIVGEYGTDVLNTTLQAAINLHDLLQLPGYEHIGRIAWVWDTNDTGDLTTDQSGGGNWIDSCVNPTNLTPLGQLIWDDNH